MNIQFDKQQKKSGYNKYGHYQFGSTTCVFCKSDRTEKTKNPINKDPLNYKFIYSCFDCKGEFGSDE